MAKVTKTMRSWLEGKFGERANFNTTERLLYSHDIAAIPSLFKPLVGRTVPDAIVPLFRAGRGLLVMGELSRLGRVWWWIFIA